MYHKITLVGRLGRDPEMRYTPSGQPVTSFSVATDRQYTDSGGQTVKETVWFRVTVWGKQAKPATSICTKEALCWWKGASRWTTRPADHAFGPARMVHRGLLMKW